MVILNYLDHSKLSHHNVLNADLTDIFLTCIKVRLRREHKAKIVYRSSVQRHS